MSYIKTVYKTVGTCSSSIKIEVEGDKIKSVKYADGCEGNLRAVCKLIAGMPISEVIERLEGTKCGQKKTSCPDQLAQALKEIVSSQQS